MRSYSLNISLSLSLSLSLLSPACALPHFVHSRICRSLCVCDADKEEKEIPLPNVKSAILNKVVAYLKHHVDNPAKPIEKPLKSALMSELASEFDADFIDVDQEELFQLVLASNYLDVPGLLDLSCAKVASMIKGTISLSLFLSFSIA